MNGSILNSNIESLFKSKNQVSPFMLVGKNLTVFVGLFWALQIATKAQIRQGFEMQARRQEVTSNDF